MKRLVKNALRKPYLTFYKYFIFEQWQIYIRKNKNILCFDNMREFKKIKTPSGHFYADPFIYEVNGNVYVFYEDYDFTKDKGVIACMSLRENGRALKNSIVLEKDYHLSFPFIFDYNDEIYMIPETLEKKRIELYRAIRFPYEWKLEKILIDDISCVDTNVLFLHNKYWLFTCIIGEEYNKDLFLFHSDNPLGEWKAHPKNPVVSDKSNARPAGRVFMNNNKIIRSSQDCAKRYGYALNFNEIKVINENEFLEEKIFTLYPEWKMTNLNNHTYNSRGNFEVIDVLSIKFDILKPIRIIKQKKYKSKISNGVKYE